MRAPRSMKALAALVCLGVFGYWGVWLPLHASGYDFTGPYEAAYALGRHVALPIYDVPAQRAFNAATLHLPDGPSDFRWTPPMAVLLIPLGLLPYHVARVLWWALGVAAALASMWLLARCVVVARRRQGALDAPASGATWRAFAVLCGAAALAQPVTDSLRLGQSTPLLLLGFALLVYGEVFDRQVWSGLGLALAVLDKLFPAALLVYLLWRGRYRAGAVTLGALALVCLVTLPVTGLGVYGAFAKALLAFSSEPNGGPVNLSLFHALVVSAAALLRPGQAEPRGGLLVAPAALLCVALFGVALAAGGWPAALRRRMRPGDRPMMANAAPDTASARFFWVSWAVTALLALEPVDWIFYYLLLLIPLAWLLSGPEAGRLVVWRLPVVGWRLLAWLALALALAPLPLDSRVAAPMSLLYVVAIGARPLGLVGIWLAQALFALDTRAAARTARAALAGAPQPA